MRRVGVVIAMVVVVLVGTLSTASAWAPGPGATFNNPRGGHAKKFKIQMKIEKSIRHAPRGSTILIASYLFDRRPAANAILLAHSRGVKVHVVLDGGVKSRASRRIRKVLNRDNGNKGLRWGPDHSFVVRCKGSCRGGGPNQAMHTKFYAFSRTGKAKKVVMVSSANLNRGAARLGYNDLYTMKGVPETYSAYRRLHDELARDVLFGDPYILKRDGRFESRFFPKRGASRKSDPAYRMLRKVHCRGAKGGSGRDGHTVIKVSMFYWGGHRGEHLARKLVALAHNGCRVTVMYGAPTRGVADILRKAARRKVINLYDSRTDRNGNGHPDLRVHTKYMLINGHYKNDHRSFRVLTGSQNWVDRSLTGGDENTLTIAGHDAFARYNHNFDFVKVKGARKVR